MASCKDCLHHNLCDSNECLLVVTDIIDDSINNIYLDNVQNRCGHFKNKTNFVEVKHGYWKDKFNRNRMATQSFCSVCGKHSGIGGIESNRHKLYCPNCGAKMDGERKCDNG
jgi:hypothetical protein